MMIALPNQDKSFTVTLFMPTKEFDSITDQESLLAFFRQHFPDTIGLIGQDRLVKDYFATKPVALISVKCNPYHWSDKVLIMGDAAHAMVPFYGQVKPFQEGTHKGHETSYFPLCIKFSHSVLVPSMLVKF